MSARRTNDTTRHAPAAETRTGRAAPKESFAKKGWQIWIVVGYLAVSAVFLLIWGLFIVSPINQQIQQEQTESLAASARICAQILPNADDAQAFAEDAVASTELRMTVIAADGSVIADSEIDPSQMENHVSRDEVSRALQGSLAVSQRTSTTDETSRLYVAVPSSFREEPVVLRLSEPTASLEAVTRGIVATSVALAVIGVLAAAIIAALSLRKTQAPFKNFDKMRADFIANTSHELKTPVAAIRLLSDSIGIAAENGNADAVKTFAEQLGNESERMQHLVVDLLDLARLENTDAGGGRAPGASARTAPSDVLAILRTSFLAHQGQAESKGLGYRFEEESPDAGFRAAVEPTDASLIFDNLIENAIMYTDAGSITVSCRAFRDRVEVAVADTGIGIPQSEQQRIFERFYRVDKARSREVGGTGLGLSIVRHAAARAHGSVLVESAPDEGSRFTVVLPKD